MGNQGKVQRVIRELVATLVEEVGADEAAQLLDSGWDENVLSRYFRATTPLYARLGSEFMPPLDEGSLLVMPTTFPGISIEEARRVLQTW